MNKMDEKYNKLIEYLRDLGNVAVAFSSGVDSTFLLKVAHDTLGDKVVAITLKSKIFPEWEQNESKEFCEREGIRQIIVEIDHLQFDDFTANPKNRCYICKKRMFEKVISVANENGFEHILEGTNVDDLGDYRPGLKAVEEMHIKSPLKEVGLNKKEIRNLSKELGLSTFDKPSFACLASRFPYGELIDEKKLFMVEKAECFLKAKGFRQVRVRIHGENLARIEVDEDDINKLVDFRIEIDSFFRQLGFYYVSLDLRGYVMGNLNKNM